MGLFGGCRSKTTGWNGREYAFSFLFFFQQNGLRVGFKVGVTSHDANDTRVRRGLYFTNCTIKLKCCTSVFDTS